MLHNALKEAIDVQFAQAITEPTERCQDALLVRLSNGVVIEIRIASAQDYAISWRWGDVELRIDTAPLHPQLATFPNHLHTDTGQLLSDPLTHHGCDPWTNISTVIAALIDDPLLQSHRE
ncbi:MAG TPA: hypothetical protein VIM63_14470 [Rhodoferax sp.]